jgi:hypothetical protein
LHVLEEYFNGLDTHARPGDSPNVIYLKKRNALATSALFYMQIHLVVIRFTGVTTGISMKKLCDYQHYF